tara:strand:+ start:508 stop:762 length:255 start_codon:yes stop_codon:yes gene_type:complete
MIKNVEKHWTDLAKKHLIGCQVIKVEYMKPKEVEDWMWYKAPLCLLMSKPNGEQFWMFPSMDDEGNDGGALFTTIEGYGCIPVL